MTVIGTRSYRFSVYITSVGTSNVGDTICVCWSSLMCRMMLMTVVVVIVVVFSKSLNICMRNGNVDVTFACVTLCYQPDLSIDPASSLLVSTATADEHQFSHLRKFRIYSESLSCRNVNIW